jgi:hypothetical protein
MGNGEIGAVEGPLLRGAIKRDVTTMVIGKFLDTPNYLEVASSRGFKAFDIPLKFSSKMTPEELWAANIKSIDRVIARNGTFVFHKPIQDISKVSGGFRKEIDHILSKGYQITRDDSGKVTQLQPPPPPRIEPQLGYSSSHQ